MEIVANHDILIKGAKDEFLAIKKVHKRWIVVVYKEIDLNDGFIITAFSTTRIQYFMKKEIIWIKES